MERREWEVNRALHAPDGAPLDAQQLAGLDAADHERVCFIVHPSITLVCARCPLDAIWRAVLGQDDAALAAIDLASRPVWLMVQRSESGVAVTRLEESAWRLAAGLFAGHPLVGA